MSLLFTPFSIGPLTLKNRIVMSPMCMYAANTEGVAQPFHHTHYTMRAYGGVSLIVQEATAVEARGRISDRDLGIWSDDHIPALKAIVDHVHQAGAKMAIQLAHAGRKCMVPEEAIIAPSAIAFNAEYRVPKALSLADIQTVIASFVKAATRAKAIGYDGIEIHAAHGYLLNEFLSPLSNMRTDAYGGPLIQRVRLLKEVLSSVRKVFNGPVWVRLSADEYAEKGHHIDETLNVVQAIKTLIDAVNVSSGGVVPFPIKPAPLYQIPLAEKIKGLGVTTLGGGLVTTYDQVEAILQDKKADAIYLGRELLLNPLWVLQQAKRYAPGLMFKPYERG